LIYMIFRRLIWPSRTTVTRKSKRKPPEKLGRMPNSQGAQRRRRYLPNPRQQNPANEQCVRLTLELAIFRDAVSRLGCHQNVFADDSRVQRIYG
jgi:hypothetical protein